MIAQSPGVAGTDGRREFLNLWAGNFFNRTPPPCARRKLRGNHFPPPIAPAPPSLARDQQVVPQCGLRVTSAWKFSALASFSSVKRNTPFTPSSNDHHVRRSLHLLPAGAHDGLPRVSALRPSCRSGRGSPAPPAHCRRPTCGGHYRRRKGLDRQRQPLHRRAALLRELLPVYARRPRR